MSKIAVLRADYYKDITDMLMAGVQAEIAIADNIELESFVVPGSFELPFIAQEVAMTKKYAGIISLGCVIRGETSHYDLVCENTARELMQVSLKNRIAHGFGLVTVENKSQALKRADINGKNMGGAAARAVLQQLDIKASLN